MSKDNEISRLIELHEKYFNDYKELTKTWKDELVDLNIKNIAAIDKLDGAKRLFESQTKGK